jgi:hypothetical protein
LGLALNCLGEREGDVGGTTDLTGVTSGPGWVRDGVIAAVSGRSSEGISEGVGRESKYPAAEYFAINRGVDAPIRLGWIPDPGPAVGVGLAVVSDVLVVE